MARWAREQEHRQGIAAQRFVGFAVTTVGDRPLTPATSHASLENIGELVGAATKSITRRARMDAPSAHLSMILGEIDSLCKLQNNWNGYGSESPNWTAIGWARRVVAATADTTTSPKRVLASAEGGVGITFRDADRYADIECFNTGEILGTLSDGTGNPVIFEVEPSEAGIDGAVERIREYLHA